LKNLIDHVLDVLFLYLKLVQYLLLELIVIFFKYDKLFFSPKRRNLALFATFKCSKIEIFGQVGFAADSDNGGTNLLIVFADSPGPLGWGFFDVTVVEVFFGDVVERVDAGAVSGGEDFGVGEFLLFAGPVFAGLPFVLKVGGGGEYGGFVLPGTNSFPPAHTLSTCIVHVCLKNGYDFMYRNTVISLNSTNQSKVIKFY
jgi:hypothetical protein